jgi:hypothetical protein
MGVASGGLSRMQRRSIRILQGALLGAVALLHELLERTACPIVPLVHCRNRDPTPPSDLPHGNALDLVCDQNSAEVTIDRLEEFQNQ